MQSYHQECGPNEDHLCWKQHKVVENTLELSWGIQEVDRGCPYIETFLETVPALCQQPETFGLIWDRTLRPSDGRYELGEHYCMTREEGQNSAHGKVTFYRDGATGLKFVIKTLLEQEIFNPEEVRIGLQTKHQNICRVYGIIVRNKKVNILLEHAGVPIRYEREWLARSSERKLLAAQQCFYALECLANHHKVHCDIKPDNLTILKEGENFTIKLIDFGSCQTRGTRLPQHTHTTMEYWAPEMWCAVDERKPIICDPAIDVYAMALTLYFLETGQHLTQRIDDLRSVMVKMPVMVKVIALPDSLPADLRVLMAACLEDPPKRLGADEACKRLQDAKIPAVYLQAVSKPENYKESWEQIMETFSHRLPTENRKPFFSCPDKLRESLALASAPKPSTPITDEPVKDVQMVSIDESKTGNPVFGSGKNFRRVIRPCPKIKASLKPPLKAKELKNINKSSTLKGKDKFALNHTQSSTSIINNEFAETIYPVTNILKNLAMKVKQSPKDPSLSSLEVPKISQKVLPDNERGVIQSTSLPTLELATTKTLNCQSMAPSKQKTIIEISDSNPKSSNCSSIRSKDINHTPNIETCDDDFGFVFDVLDNNGLTGADDDITEWLYQSLSESEKESSKTANKVYSFSDASFSNSIKNNPVCIESDVGSTQKKEDTHIKKSVSNISKSTGSKEHFLPDFSQI